MFYIVTHTLTDQSSPMKLFELTTNTRVKFGRTLYQIKATVDFERVKEGDLGGWIEDERSVRDDCWLHQDAVIYENATMHGGVMRGGEMWGGVMRGGEMHGGEMHGGVMRGGVMRGGVMWGGEMREGNHIGFANVGSDNGYLLCYIDSGIIMLSRGCFHGTIDEFYEKVEETHGRNEHGQFYKSLRPIIEAKLNKFLEKS